MPATTAAVGWSGSRTWIRRAWFPTAPRRSCEPLEALHLFWDGDVSYQSTRLGAVRGGA
ncbi:MAG: hypothetical protein WDM77_19980 [Steroidobacteraceae bacterium]